MRTGKRFVPGLVIGISMFICMTSGLVNPSDAQAAYTILHKFIGGAGDGLSPWYGGPVLSGSTLYGMTAGGGKQGSGVLFKINAAGTGFQILHTFSSTNTDGATPYGSLALSGSTLYGFTAFGGGPYAYAVGGTVFRINTDGTGYQILHNFGGGTLNQCHPCGTPILSGSKLYGMTSSEGTGLNGEIFAINTNGTGYQVLHEFGGKPGDGAFPYGSLTLSGSKLYGMTSAGGSEGISTGGSGNGVIFAINTNGTGYQVLHNFGGSPNDGANPTGSLTLVGSKLYGMTANGGTDNGSGVLFAITTNGTGYEVLLDFHSVNLSTPRGSLTLSGSTLYGTASGGCSGGGNGAVFQINTDGTGYQLLHCFPSSQGDGGDPLGDVTLSGATLYGWTYGGGIGGGGVIFSCPTKPKPRSDTTMMLLLLSD
jgi:uncharacterized repeat protein (TIGR03803 family)